MLVLSRHEKERVLFPNLGISVQVVRINRDKVKLGIDAPADVQVLREELVDLANDFEVPKAASITPEIKELFRSRLSTMANELCELHRQLEENQIDDVDPMIFRIYREIKSIEDDVAGFGQGGSKPRPQKRRALVVDDCHNESHLLAGFLRCRNFDVETRDNGKNAIDYLERHDTPDCVLLDMNMPRFDGRWTIRKIRENRKYHNLHVCAVSGMSSEEAGIEVGPLGVNRWFQKPLDPEAIATHIEKGCSAPKHLPQSVKPISLMRA